jgi:hypothetical protein
MVLFLVPLLWPNRSKFMPGPFLQTIEDSGKQGYDGLTDG